MASADNLGDALLACSSVYLRAVTVFKPKRWRGSLITLLRLQLMVCFAHISRKTETRKNRNLGFLCKTEPKPNQKWNHRTVTALVYVASAAIGLVLGLVLGLNLGLGSCVGR